MSELNQSKEHLKGVGMLIVVRGIPGSGKSYLVENLVDTLKDEEADRIIRIDPDEYRYKDTSIHKVSAFTRDLASEEELLPGLQKMALEGISEGKIVIWEQLLTSLKKPEQVNFIRQAIYPSRLLFIEVVTDKSAAWERIMVRNDLGQQIGPTNEQFDDYTARYVSFQDKKVDFEYLVVNGEKPAEENVKLILSRL